ncbi:hypothetical protein MG293_018602 [Ovis ammon polii]|uniref:Uncharacterized protein n=1 Tax=Ovis ammon polii TaxID=230172 RepID=A0AAD4TQX0_OVIAM|nr:hypothetical protein MG293_018602 [Ovis ammon polii]
MAAARPPYTGLWTLEMASSDPPWTGLKGVTSFLPGALDELLGDASPVDGLVSLEGSISSAGLVKVRIIGVYTLRPLMPLSPTPGLLVLQMLPEDEGPGCSWSQVGAFLRGTLDETAMPLKSLASSTSARRPCAVAEPEGETGKTCGKTQLMPSITVITAFAIENRILEKKIDFSVLIVINPRLRRIEHTQSSLIYERKLKYLRCFPFVCELLFQRNVEGLLSPTCSAKISASAWQRLLCGSSLPGLCVSQRQPASRKQTNNLISVIHKCVNTSAWKPICQRLNYDAEVLVKAVERRVLRWVASALNLAIPPVST